MDTAPINAVNTSAESMPCSVSASGGVQQEGQNAVCDFLTTVMQILNSEGGEMTSIQNAQSGITKDDLAAFVNGNTSNSVSDDIVQLLFSQTSVLKNPDIKLLSNKDFNDIAKALGIAGNEQKLLDGNEALNNEAKGVTSDESVNQALPDIEGVSLEIKPDKAIDQDFDMLPDAEQKITFPFKVNKIPEDNLTEPLQNGVYVSENGDVDNTVQGLHKGENISFDNETTEISEKNGYQNVNLNYADFIHQWINSAVNSEQTDVPFVSNTIQDDVVQKVKNVFNQFDIADVSNYQSVTRNTDGAEILTGLFADNRINSKVYTGYDAESQRHIAGDYSVMSEMQNILSEKQTVNNNVDVSGIKQIMPDDKLADVQNVDLFNAKSVSDSETPETYDVTSSDTVKSVIDKTYSVTLDDGFNFNAKVSEKSSEVVQNVNNLRKSDTDGLKNQKHDVAKNENQVFDKFISQNPVDKAIQNKKADAFVNINAQSNYNSNLNTLKSETADVATQPELIKTSDIISKNPIAQLQTLNSNKDTAKAYDYSDLSHQTRENNNVINSKGVSIAEHIKSTDNSSGSDSTDSFGNSEKDFYTLVNEVKKNIKTNVSKENSQEDKISVDELQTQAKEIASKPIFSLNNSGIEKTDKYGISEQVAKAVTDKINSYNYSESDKSFTIKLSPEGLGDVIVKMTKESGKIAITLSATLESTAKVLSEKLPDLQNSLRLNNADVSSVKVQSSEQSSAGNMMSYNGNSQELFGGGQRFGRGTQNFYDRYYDNNSSGNNYLEDFYDEELSENERVSVSANSELNIYI